MRSTASDAPTASDTEATSTAPPSPETLAALRLKLTPGVGCRLYGDLLEHFGTASAVLAASRERLLALPGIGDTLAEAIASAGHRDLEPLLALCQRERIGLLPREGPLFPRMLREIHDPPSLLFSSGELLPSDQLAVAIVGTRHATRYGLQVAQSLARGLAMAGLTIVSGLARGIDAAAHRAALDAGGRTIAVLGGGLLNVYPAEHNDLAAAIAGQGVVLSEALPQVAPKSGSFPRRNRIISGLSLGVLVVEAGDRSGALISARLAGEQGREVFAVPGRIDSRMSRGCHQLIRDGAKLVQCVDDVLEELGPLVEPCEQSDGSTIRHPAELKLSPQELRVLQSIGTEPTEIDLIVQSTGLPVSRVLSTVSVLEMRKLVTRITGTRLARV